MTCMTRVTGVGHGEPAKLTVHSCGRYLYINFKSVVTRMVTWLQTKEIVIPPNSNTFSEWRRTCHVSLVKTS